MHKNYFYLACLILCCFFVSCSESEDILEQNTNTNSLLFVDTNSNKNIPIYYYVPENSNTNTPIVMVFHGAGRNAKDYRNALMKKANEYKFIVIAPEFTVNEFPGGDGYNLGNVYLDGDNPSLNSLNTEKDWAFSLVEPIFSFIKKELKNTSQKFHVIGHSAGAQFGHRLIMFAPNGSYDKIIISAAGWYTVPDFTTKFPYGFKNSILENIDLETFFSKKVDIIVGELDNNPNANGLRRNQFADIQGVNRFTRANYFYESSKNLATLNSINFNWKIKINQGLNHDFIPALESAADIIFK